MTQPDEISKKHESDVHLYLEVRPLTAAEAISTSPLNTVNDRGSGQSGSEERSKGSPVKTALKALSTGGLSLITKGEE